MFILLIGLIVNLIAVIANWIAMIINLIAMIINLIAVIVTLIAARFNLIAVKWIKRSSTLNSVQSKYSRIRINTIYKSLLIIIVSAYLYANY